MVLVIPRMIVTATHLYKLLSKEADAMRSIAIVGEVANIAEDMATVSNAAAVKTMEISGWFPP